MLVNKKKIILFLKLTVICYSGIGIGLYYLQDKILFSSESHFNPDSTSSLLLKDFIVPINRRDTLHIIKYFSRDSFNAGNVFYFQDVSQSMFQVQASIQLFTEKGFSVWLFDYNGCKGENGKIAESKLYSAAYQLKQLAESNNPSSKLIIYGNKFGAAIAANLSNMLNADQLILESPYVSIPDYYHSQFPIYPWNSMARLKMKTVDFLKDVHSNVVIFADKRKSEFSQALKSGDNYFIIHPNEPNDIAQTDLYKNEMVQILKKVNFQSK